jgi:hypothetical protein
MTVLTTHDRRRTISAAPAWSVQGAIIVVTIVAFLSWLLLFELTNY